MDHPVYGTAPFLKQDLDRIAYYNRRIYDFKRADLPIRYNDNLFLHVKQVTEYLKVANLQHFYREIQNRIEDLHFTKKRFICLQSKIANEESDQVSASTTKVSLLRKNIKA